MEEEVQAEVAATMTVATMVTVEAAVVAAVAIRRSLGAVSHHRATTATAHHPRRARVHSAAPLQRSRW